MAGIRHVWVRPPNLPVPHPGLLLAWRREREEWIALVTYIDAGGRAITEWVPRDRMVPVPPNRPNGSAYG